jgi:hypothetical protein
MSTSPRLGKRLQGIVVAIFAWAAGGVGVMGAPSPASAQSAMEQPRMGQLQRSGPANGSRHNAWSMPGTTLAAGAGWQRIKLLDIDSDGFADLCGVYGPLAGGNFVYGCVLNTPSPNFQDPDARVFAGTLRVASAFNGSFHESVHSTIDVVDMRVETGSNPAAIRRHLCGRTPGGIRCHRFENGAFQPAVLMQASFSNAAGWNQAKYASTIAFVRLRGLPAVCGRGVGGVLCFSKFDGQAFFSSTVVHLEPSFSDANGWGHPQHYETLRFVDMNGDGHADVCGRGYEGIWCATWNAGLLRFNAPTRWTPQFADAQGWNDERYYASIRLFDLNADGRPDVCGRGDGGLVCEPSNGMAFFNVGSVTQSEFGDALGWGSDSKKYRSLTLLKVDDDALGDVCGLNTDPGGGALHWKCTLGQPSVPILAFQPNPVIRTGDVNVFYQLPVTGRIHHQGRTGICWPTGGEVRCSNRWIW